MRQAGTVPNAELAQRLADYLLTQQIETRVDSPDGDAADWAIWIRDDEQVEAGKAVLEEFLADPEAEKYVVAGRQAARLRKEQQRHEKQLAERQIQVRRRWERPSGVQVVTMSLILASCAVGVLSRFGSQTQPVISRLSFVELAPADKPGMVRPLRPLSQELRRGQYWRLATPMLIHFGVFHLLFNMMWLYRFGSDIEFRRGSLRFAVMVLTIAVTSNLGQYWIGGNAAFGGMSGVNFGLFGYLWVKTRFDPRSGFYLDDSTILLLVIWFVICFFGWVGPVANWAHGAGLLAGAAIAYAPVAWRRLNA